MKIKDNKNLVYNPYSVRPDGTGAHCPPNKSIIVGFELFDTKLSLVFANKYLADIRAKNLEGQRELMLINQRMPEFIGKTYEELLNFNFEF